MLLNWEVSDPEIAEIVSSDNSSVTIKGLKRGDVAVTASVGDFKKSVTIHVLDKNYEDLKGKFQDISGYWAEETILEAVYRGLFNGVSSDLFDPDSAITRAMFVTVLYLYGGSARSRPEGRLHGCGRGQLLTPPPWIGPQRTASSTASPRRPSIRMPPSPASRWQRSCIATPPIPELDVSAEADLSAYADASSVSGYAQAAMQWAVANGVINGTSATTLEPAGDPATRAQAATVLVRFQNSMKS